jgi:hypothetical protein
MDSYPEDDPDLREAIGMSRAAGPAVSAPTIDNLQLIFEALEHSDLLREEYESVAQGEPMTYDKGVRSLLQNLSVQFSIDLEEAEKEFQTRRNQNDREDVIDVG